MKLLSFLICEQTMCHHSQRLGTFTEYLGYQVLGSSLKTHFQRNIRIIVFVRSKDLLMHLSVFFHCVFKFASIEEYLIITHNNKMQPKQEVPQT